MRDKTNIWHYDIASSAYSWQGALNQQKLAKSYENVLTRKSGMQILRKRSCPELVEKVSILDSFDQNLQSTGIFYSDADVRV